MKLILRIWLFGFFGILYSHTTFSQVSGIVYQDFNGNGVKDNYAGYNEVGLAGVTVLATNQAGTLLSVSYSGSTGSTGASGNYVVSGGVLGQIRLEFIMPDGHTFASKGSASGTTLMFPTTATQNLGVYYPGSFSAESNPRVATQYYTNGNNQIPGSSASTPQSLVTFPHDNNGSINSLANMASVGATWGLAYHKQSGKLFSSAFAKRHVNTGALGLNGIYVTSSAQTANSLAATTGFVNLNTVNSAFNAGSVLRNFSPGGGDAYGDNHDENIFDLVGKTGMGGLAVSDDGQYLYTVNLNDRKVWRIEIGPNGVAPTSASQIVAYADLPSPCSASTFRPFALKFYKGELYVGGVCDGVGSGSVNRNSLKATVYKVSASVNPSSASFSLVLDFPLNFNRQANVDSYSSSTLWSVPYSDPNGTDYSLSTGSWRPWVRSVSEINVYPVPEAGSVRVAAYPQPILSGLDFDVDGSMILGFADRSAHQLGFRNYFPNSGNTIDRIIVTSGGDLLRANKNNGTYVLESNGSVGTVSSAGTNNGQGPGGGEFYFEDVWNGTVGTQPYGILNPSTQHHYHDETALGGVAAMHGKESVLATSFDPVLSITNEGAFTGGIRWYSNLNGRAKDAISLYAADLSNFGKASGVGDLELLTGPAPIEIGNRVWLDTNNNGIQDAGEPALGGVTVTLYASNCTTLLGTVTTNPNGEYYFSSAAGVNTSNAIFSVNLYPDTEYCLVFPTVSGSNTISSKPNKGGNDLIDSDANSQGRINFTTGSAGENNHSFDVGYTSCPTVPVASEITASPASICTSGSSTLSASCSLGSPVWYANSSATSPIGNTTVSPASTTIYYVRCESGTCFSSVLNTTVTVNTTPVIVAGTPVCAANGLTYSVPFTIPSGATLTSTAGNVSGNVVSNIPAGTLATVTVSLNGCTASTTVTQNCVSPCNASNPTITGAGTICQAQNRTLSASGCTTGYTYLWSNNATTSSIIVSPIVTTEYTVKCVGSGSCESSVPDSATIVVTSKPDAGTGATVCAPETGTAIAGFSPSGGTWTQLGTSPVSASISAAGNVTGLSANGEYRFIYTLNGCSDTVSVVRNPTTSTEICPGESVTISAPAGYSNVSWLRNDLPISGATGLIYDASLPGTYSYSAIDENGCEVELCCPIVVTAIDVPQITVNSPAICSGQTATLTANGCTGGTVSWSSGLTGNPATTPALTSNQSYTATCTIGTCTSTATANVTINPIPTITAGTPVCAADGLTYSVTFTIPAGATINTTAGIVTGNVVSEINSGVTATITVTSAEGCINTTTVMQNCTIPCNAPNPTVAGDMEICQGESTTLTASGCTSGYTYLWSNNATTASITVNAAGTYTVKCVETGRPECESINPGSATVVVNPTPTITAGTPVCALDGQTYSVTFTIPAGATIATTAGTVTGNVVSGINSGVTATITVTSAEGCTNTTTVMQNCTVPCNAPTPTVAGDMEICQGESTTLTASGCTTGYTYLWSNNSTTASITVNAAGTYTVKCVETGRPECESTTPASATVVVNPIPTITAGTPVCAASGLTYSVTFTIPAGATITTTAGIVTGNVVSEINSGVTATITVTSAEGCTNTTTVMQNCSVPCNAPNPTVAGDMEICQGESTTLTASGCTTGYMYLWSTNATTASITVNTAGTYTVKCIETGRPECESINPGSASVVVNPIPTITAGTPVCAVSGLTYSVTFTIPAGATIATTAGIVTGNVVSGINSGVTATITVTSSEGCTNTTTVMQNCTVPCNAPNPTVAGDMEICQGESTTLTANGCITGYTYLWSNSATTAAITVNAAGTYTVKCVETGRPECESINPGSATVTVNPIPTITAGTPVCAADGQTYSVTFTIPAGAIITTTAGTVTGNVVSGINSGVTATITVTSAEGCTNTTTVTQNCTVPCNAPNPTVAGDMEICQGESTTLTASGCTTGYTYLWSNNATTASITVNAAGTYTVKCVETARPTCESLNPGSATVVVNPTPTITAGTPVCALDGQTYSVTFTIPAGATITTTAGIVSGNVVSGINSGVTATISVTSVEGCTNTTTVTQNCTIPCNAPNPTVAGDMEICQGESTTLTASGCTTGYTYLWSNNATTASITVNAAGTYTVKCVETGRPTCESLNPGSATVAVNSTPTITAGTPVCTADGLTYSVTFTIPAGTTITSTAGAISGNVVSGINSGVTATITVTSAEGCTNTTTVTQNCTVPVFDLALRKVLPNGAKNPTVTPGSTVTFKIEVWNQGNVAAQNVVVTDYIPNGLTLVADGNWTAGTGVATLTNPIAALAAGDSTSVNISFTVNTGFTGSIRNFAEISDADNTAGLPDVDSTPDSNPNNDGTPKDDEINNEEDDEDDHDYEDITVSPTPVFDLALRKTMAPGSKTIYKVGDVVTFNITVFNQGTVAATSVDLVDYIPAGLTLQTGSDWTLDGSKARWTGALSNLAPAAQETVQISFVVNASATGVIINTAEISGATNPQNLEDIDSTPDDDKDNDGPVRNDEINEDGQDGRDEDDHDIEPITICTDGKCITSKARKIK